MKSSQFFFFLFLCLCFGNTTSLTAQSAGDTISVQAFKFSSTTRDSQISFPDLPDISYEKVMLKYTMRCKEALVSTGTERNKGCGEWDYSCNTYLVDSSKVEAVDATVSSHFITNYSESSFPYMEQEVYDYYRGIQKDIEITSTNSETTASIGSGAESLVNVLSTDQLAGKSQYLYTANELSGAGLLAGNIDGISMHVLNDSGEAKYLKIKMKQTSKSALSGNVDFDDLTEVYYKNTSFQAATANRFQFITPFSWDGTSNIIVEFSFSNIDADALSSTQIEGDNVSQTLGLSAHNEQQIILANNNYIEANDYTGIAGDQNRTVEAWIKTDANINAEICSWGKNVANEKWVFRITSAGKLRVENAAGGTESTMVVTDGQWHHVACILNGDNLSDIRFVIDGVLDINAFSDNTDINTVTDGGFKVRISRGVNNRYLNAEIDHVRIWNTNLNVATINNWMRLKIDDTHPKYTNLQLNYEFNEENGIDIIDSSVHGRNATIIGDTYRSSYTNGVGMFKDFSLTQKRPKLDFHQGDYVTTETSTTVDRPVEKSLEHFVITRSIEQTSPNAAFDDNIINSDAVQYWLPEQNIYDELTGELISQNTLTPDGEITITDLSYTRRFPWYNELLSFVTPYGIGVDFGQEGKTWYFDMTDYIHILKGNKRLLMTLGGQWQEEMDLEFLFIVGTPPRDVLQYEQVWQGTNRIGSGRISDIINDVKFAPKDIQLSTDATTFKLKSSITGHGAEGEFHQNGGIVNHRILLDETQRYSWPITQECSENPIFPQGGTWVYDRQGWCPGERSLLKENDMTSYVTPGSSVKVDYITSNPQDPSGDYRYHVAHQVVGYGDPNHQLDAAIVEVVAPNNTALYTRVGKICGSPSIVIQNTGATTLNSLMITYWINESSSPQTYEWNGSLAFLETETITLPNQAALWYDIQADNNLFHVTLANPNQATDEYAFNNSYTSSFDVPDILPNQFILEFKTNNNSLENSYSLFDADGNEVGSNNLFLSNNLNSDNYDLADGCFKLEVNDSGDDGLEWWANPGQGSGFIRIKNMDDQIIKIFETDFGGGFEYSFSTDFVISVEDLEFLTSIKVFPNPTNNFCTVEAKDIADVDIVVYNLLGQVLQPTIISQSNDAVTFDISQLPIGAYMLSFKKGEITTTRKIIKQ